MLPSASPLTTSWPIRRSVAVFPDRPDQFRCFALVAINAEGVSEIARTVGLIADQQALPILGGGKCLANSGFVAADLFDDGLQHVDRVVVRDGKIVGRHL